MGDTRLVLDPPVAFAQAAESERPKDYTRPLGAGVM